MIRHNMKNKTLGKRLFVLLGTTLCIGLLYGCQNSESDVADSGDEVSGIDINNSIIENYKGNETSNNEINEDLSEDNNVSNENIIGSGMYKVGKDIEAGEYIIFANTANRSGYYCLSNDSNSEDIISNENFDYNSILTIRDNEYLELSHSYAIPFSDVEELEANGHDGMFKVGTHISPGEYELLVSQNDDSGYYCIYNDSRCDNIESNDIFERNTYVTVKDGQYLKLSGCKISELIQEDHTELNEESVQEDNAASDEKLGCPFTAKEFEKIYTSKLDKSKYNLETKYDDQNDLWGLNVFNGNAIITIIDLEEENAPTNKIQFLIEYGLEESMFQEIVSAFIETLYPDIDQENYDYLLSTFTENYVSESGSICGTRGEGEINIVMASLGEVENGVIISALKSE